MAHLTHCMLGNFSRFFVNCSFSFFLNTIRVSNSLWIQIWPNKMSGLIWVQTVCKGCLQTTKYITGRHVKSYCNIYLVFGFHLFIF